MALFIYKVKNDVGRTLVGIAEAENVKEVKRQFHVPDHFFISARAYNSRHLARIRLKLDDLLMFNNRLSCLVEAGVPILQALSILWRQSEHHDVQIIVSYMREELEEGASLWEVFSAFPAAFPPIYLALINVAEVGAGMANILKKLSQYLEDQKKFYSRLSRATMYPAFVLGFALLVLIGLFVFIVPTFEKVILRLHGELPFLSKVLFGISNLLCNPYFDGAVVICVIIALFLWRFLSKIEAYKYMLDYWKIKAPLLKNVLYPLSVARFTRSLSLLLGSGVPLVTAVEVCNTTINNSWLQKAVEDIRQNLLDGGSLYDAFKITKAFPFMVVEMIGIGETGGKLQQLLEMASAYLEEEADYALTKYLTYLEPLMIIAVGAIVLFVLLGIYLPIFSIQSVLRTL